MLDVEDKHFWYVGMRNITEVLLKNFLINNKNKILDTGCGTGRNMLMLEKYGKTIGIDVSSTAIELGKKRGIYNIKKASINNIPLPNNYFDMVTCFDVLGHKKVDEKRAINEIYRVLKPEGIFLLRVAAYKWLFSYHDILVHNDRRYSKRVMISILKNNKFIPLKATYVNTFLFPLIVIKRFIFKIFKLNARSSDSEHKLSFLNYLYLIPLLFESFLVKYINLPFGVSIMVVARKK